MAINKKLIHFKNKQTFELEVANGNILDSSIVFIKDSKEIYTHGTYYSSAVDLSEYLTISAANSKYLTISNAANTYLTISNAANTYLPIGNYITSIPTANGTTAGIVKQGGDVTISNGVISVVDDSHNHIISNVDGLQTALDGKVPTSRTINGKALTTNITLSAADVSADASGSANSALSSAKSYTDTKISELVGLAPDALNTVYELAEAMESNQDAVDLLNTAIGNKVDKVSGKGLSTNDYTTTEKNKLAGIASGAEVNQNAFSNVTVGETTISADSKTDTLTLVAGSNVTITPDATNDKITIAAKDTTYSFSNENPTLAWGTKSTIGTVGGTALTVTMPSNPNSHYSTAIKAGASETNSNASVTNPYIKVLDNATYKSLIRLVGSGATTISSDSSGNITISSTNTTYGEASSSTAGLMSSTDKAKLDGIASGANKYSLPLAASGTRGGIQLGYSASGANVPVAVSSEKAYVALTKTAVTSALGYTPPTSDTNTHYTTRIYAGASGTAANATATSPYVKITDDNTYRNQIRLIGSGATTVTSDDSGNITINSTNTTYSAGDGISLSSGKFSHADTSTLSGSYGPTADVTGNNNATIVIPQITVDAYGHVTGVTNRTYTSKDSNTTYSAITASELSTGTATTARSVTAKVIADYVNGLINSKIAAADAMIYKGTLGTNGTITALPATHTTGWTYKVITAGTYAGKICEVGDMIICLTDGTAANAAHWTVILTNVDGAVVGPASSTDAAVAVFNGTTGKVIKNSGFTIGKSVPSNAVFTDTWRSVTDSVSTTSSSTGASATAVKTAYDKAVSAYNLANGKTSNTGTVTSVATGVGLTGGSITTSGTVKAKLRSETALTIDSAAATTTSGRVYPVAVDKTGYLAVNVPWTNTTYSFTNKAATLAWNSAVTVATVGGTNITVKLPANPNSDTKVTLTVTTTNANYPLLFAPSGLTATTTTTSYFSTGIYANASTKSLYATNFYTTSDRQFKTNIERILTSDNCPVVKQFDWKETGTRSYGFIAQELEELGYEELVGTDESGVKTVNYNAALSLVVGKMQARIEELAYKILELENEIKILKNG